MAYQTSFGDLEYTHKKRLTSSVRLYVHLSSHIDCRLMPKALARAPFIGIGKRYKALLEIDR